MSLLELEEKIECYLNSNVINNNLQDYAGKTGPITTDSDDYYENLMTYITDNKTIFLDLYDTVSVRTKIIINGTLNIECEQTLLDCFLESGITWTFFLSFIRRHGLHFHNKELLIESYRQEKLDSVNNVYTYRNLLTIFFETNHSFDWLPDAFIDQYQNINDDNHEFFWDLLDQKDIKLLKRYANKYQFKITDNDGHITGVYKTWLPIDIIKEYLMPYTDGFDANNNVLNMMIGDNLTSEITEHFKSKMYYQSVEITNENILEIVWQMMNDNKHIQLATIAQYFDHMTMSECVCWYARIKSKYNDKRLFALVSQTSSSMFLEYAKDFVNTYDIESSLTNKNTFRFNLNEPFIKTIIELKPEMLDLLICYALRTGDRILNMLIPNITCQDVIKYLEEHPELLEKQALL